MKNLFAVLFLFVATAAGAQTSYYIDDVAGNDSYSGHLPGEAWKTLEKINAVTLEPGDSVRFRRGGSWYGNFTPQGSGNKELKLVVCAYGSGPSPVLDARGEIAPGETASYTIRFFNQEYFQLRDLKVKNFKPFEEPVMVGENVYANSEKTGIYIQGEDCGSLNGIAIINLEICDVNGSMNTKHNGGIFLKITRNEDPVKQIPSNFVDLLVSDCWIHDVDMTGFANTSAWQNRSLKSKWGDELADGEVHDWYPSHKIIIRNNRFERTGSNALVVRVAKAPLIEHSMFTHCSIKGSGNASYPFNCDDAVFQYNEACYTCFNTRADSWNGKRDADAGGFDSDWMCKNTIIQYNYSHHNGYGGVLICCKGNHPTAFNDGTILRYNIFENNQHHIVRVSGPVSNTMIYNNLFYSGIKSDPVMILFHKGWGIYSDSVAYHNNIFYSDGKGNYINLGKSTRNFFGNNLFRGEIENQPLDPGDINADPVFTGSPGSGNGWKGWLRYMLSEGSPAIDGGIIIGGMPSEDFRGEPVYGNPDIGPFEYTDHLKTNKD